MIDEDMAVEVLERLARTSAPGATALAGAVLLRPAPDRTIVAGVADPAAAAKAWAGEELPADAAWWLSLTSWGRLGMGGDMTRAAAWLRDAGGSTGAPP